MPTRLARALVILTLLLPAPAAAQNRSEDEYTRYELLDPATASFKIIYDVTAVTPGATFYFNPIRRGSIASDESVIDLASGRPLTFEQVSGAAAREAGLTNLPPPPPTTSPRRERSPLRPGR